MKQSIIPPEPEVFISINWLALGILLPENICSLRPNKGQKGELFSSQQQQALPLASFKFVIRTSARIDRLSRSGEEFIKPSTMEMQFRVKKAEAHCATE
jgi:hypothetical protein